MSMVQIDRENYDESPVGLRILAVDDDPVGLKILESMLRRCEFHVTAASQAIMAIKLLREDKEQFDLVISEVPMPDMDGFKLLQIMGREMDLPVIMLSANCDPKIVMKGISHSACDYVLKLVRIEELKNIWQHLLTRKTFGRGRQLTNAVSSSPYTPAQIENLNGSDDPSAQNTPQSVWANEDPWKYTNAATRSGFLNACDDLLKPVRIVPIQIEELKNIWQGFFFHVLSSPYAPALSSPYAPGSILTNSALSYPYAPGSILTDGALPYPYTPGYATCIRSDNVESFPLFGNAAQIGKFNGKRKNEDCASNENGNESDYPSAQKKPRFLWTSENQLKFLEAVKASGFEKAVPERVLGTMNVEGLTLEEVANHIQVHKGLLFKASVHNCEHNDGSARG